MYPSRLLIALLAAGVFAGCFDNALRDNPLDPRGDRSGFKGMIEGQVTDRAVQPIAGTEVQLRSTEGISGQMRSVVTGGDGRFQFDGLGPGEYELTAAEALYATRIDTLTLQADQPFTHNMMLNGLPRLLMPQLASVHISRVWPPPTNDYVLEFLTEVDDPDGAIDVREVGISIPDLAYRDTLSASEDGSYEIRIPQEELPGGSLEAILGRQIQGWIKDNVGDSVMQVLPPVARLIHEVPVAVSPQGGAVVVVRQPVLTWSCADVTYPFTYRIDVVRTDDFVRNLIHTEHGIDPGGVCTGNETGAFTVPVELADGLYFWTVSIVDAFGNRSRSREAGFLIN